MSVEYKRHVCSANECWDKIAFEVWGDGTELLFQTIMEANRQYSRTLAFDGSEVLRVPLGDEAPVIVSSGDPSQQTVINLVGTPWTD